MEVVGAGRVRVTFGEHHRGCAVGDIRVGSVEDAPLIHQLAKDFKAEVGEGADVHLQIWAGPFELMVAVRDLLAASGAAAGGIAALLTALKRRHPHYDIEVHPDEQTTVKITGHELPPELAEQVNRYFAARSDASDLVGSRIEADPEDTTDLESDAPHGD